MATVRDWLRDAMALEFEERGTEEGRVVDDETGPELSPKQRAAVDRGAGAVRRYGGVLLADAVGLGKTRVAVAMVRRITSAARRRGGKIEPVLFAVPARLRRNWRRAVENVGWRPGRDAEIVSHHRLSRDPWEGRPPVVVVDEAHRFRNPAAKRSRNLAKITARAPPILVTATPVCTRRRDLFELLRLFVMDSTAKSLVGMGLEEAFEADEAGDFDVVEILEEVVIRRRTPDFGAAGRPDVAFELLEYTARDDERWLWRNLEARLEQMAWAATGEDWPRGLLVNNLLRMWESGPEALRRSLDELAHFHERWLEAAESGRSIERPGFREIFGGVDRRQQVFPFLYGHRAGELPDEETRSAVQSDYRALEDLAERVDGVRREGSSMVEAIADEVAAHPDERFLVFAVYRAAAEEIFDALADRSGLRVGLVTGDDARATGLGSTTDREILDRFRAGEQSGRSRRQKLRILVATDCLSEGINLQGCPNLVLADLPYSPVKLEQRIGRIARPGSRLDRVTVYLPRPRSWTDSLGLRRRLGDRLEMARRLGSGHLLANAVGDFDANGRDEDDSPGPLAALTLEDRLWCRLREETTGGAPAFAKIESETRRTGELWLRVRIRSAVTRHVWLWIPKRGQTPQVRRSRQIPGLASLADDERTVRPSDGGGPLWERARRWMRRRKSLLVAAQLAPPLVGRNSEPVEMWRRLKTEMSTEHEGFDVDNEQLEFLRGRLLWNHPPGIRCEMRELLDADVPVGRLVRFVEQLPKPPKRSDVEVESVAGLEM